MFQQAGAVVRDLRRRGITETTLYRWRVKYGGMEVSEARRLKQLEAENSRLKRLVGVQWILHLYGEKESTMPRTRPPYPPEFREQVIGLVRAGRPPTRLVSPMDERRSTSVPGQYLGFSIQASRFLDHLLRAEVGDAVSLEVFADTGLTKADGSVIAEESKSRNSNANPICDHAPDFWKTIGNWVDAVVAGQLDPGRTTFQLYASRKFTGGFAQRFHDADTISLARSALHDAMLEVWGDTPDQPRTDKIAGELRPHMSRVFRADPDVVASVIAAFHLEHGSGRSFDDLKGAMLAKFVPEDLVDETIYSMLGWIKRQTDSAIEETRPAVIRYEEFHRVVTALIQRLNHRQILQSLAGDPKEEQVREHLRVRRYVRQLNLIATDDDEKLRAVTDFLRAEIDAVIWAEKMWIHEDSLKEFQNDLVAVWKNYKQRHDIVNRAADEVERGILVYLDCCSHGSMLQGVAVPPHFCRGTFHALADEPLIGWHPRYSDLVDTDI